MLNIAFCFVVPWFCAIFASEMKITKKKYLISFLIVTALLAVLRLIFPQVATKRTDVKATVQQPQQETLQEAVTDIAGKVTSDVVSADTSAFRSRFFKEDGQPVKNRILSVPGFQTSFPDQQDVQLAAAEHWGVKPVQDRADAEKRKAELVYVGSNPYFFIDKLHSSIPYLVPRASVLLQDIGRNYFDSLQVKGIPLHKVIVTSVMRSKADVEHLRGHNGNATENSCHLYGTTFDVCYNRYKTVEAPGEKRRRVQNDTLKWVLAEVLDDMRASGRCYVKYEVHQGCFHITVR